MLVFEDGPSEVFARFRRWAGVPDGVGEIHGFLPSVLTCILCCSVWTATAMGVAWYVHPVIPAVVAAWAVALVVDRIAR